MRSLVLAIDAGSEAEEAARVFATSVELPKGSNRPFGGLAARWQRKAVVSPGGDQARRSCQRIDEFATALAALAAEARNDSLKAQADFVAQWSDLLWESNSNGPAVYNDVRATVAKLNQFKTKLILDVPVEDLRF